MTYKEPKELELIRLGVETYHMPITEIARQLKKSRQYVALVCKKFGIKRIYVDLTNLSTSS